MSAQDGSAAEARHAVLIVDDEETFRKALADGISLLRGDRYEAVCVGSVDEALPLLRERKFAALVTDIRMPGKDGLQLLLEMRRMGIRVPTLVTTAYGSPSVHAQAARSGAVRYLEKPFPLEHLIDFLEMATSQPARPKTLDLIEVVEMLCMGRRTMHVTVRTRDLQGSIFIHNGELVHATAGDREGVDALLELLVLPQPQIATAPMEEVPKTTIQQPWRELTEEAWRRRTLVAPPRRAAPQVEPEAAERAPAAQEAPQAPALRTSFWGRAALSEVVKKVATMPGVVRAPRAVELDDERQALALATLDSCEKLGQVLSVGPLLGCVVKTRGATLVFLPVDELHAVSATLYGPGLPERRLYSLARAMQLLPASPRR